MTSRLLLKVSVLTGLLLCAVPARGEAPGESQRFGLGLDIGVVGTPTGHLGIPAEGTEDGVHLPAELLLRWQGGQIWALNAGIGLAHAALGLTAWVGGEIFHPVLADARGRVALELYLDPGLLLGFAGPDYYARAENAFVGYAYAVNGAVAFGFRLPVGVRVRLPKARLDLFAEAVPILTVTPAAEQLFEVAVGFRVRL